MENLGRTTSGDDVIARSGTLLGHDLLQHGGLEQQHTQRLGSMETPGETASGDDVIARSGTLFALDLLDCPICFNPLATPIFQCVNGHIACCTCCAKLMNKCPSCTLPLGNYRCLILEKVVEAVIVPCGNAKHGCLEKLSYCKKLAHEKVCDSYVLHCPAPECNYSAFHLDLYRHYTSCHKASSSRFRCGQYDDALINIREQVLVLQEYDDLPLFILQSFMGAHGVHVAVNVLAPSAQGLWELGYDLIYQRGNERFTHESEEMTRIQRVSFEAPVVNYMYIPYSSLDESLVVKMQIRIRKSRGDGEEEEA
ncbi:hypothetical protein CARUB_v10021683mg [Capsella rubella]|uniref:RING-type E3 ubiquitin transferase n=1 Tax=Capsella rubella TaxID=81985 RepID=R0I7V5_9BRAS|nr:E3 ubiquitin-protein ligase SINA-like 3 [Capsella rubella]EOA34180.1 hypothetical protein CARUB_v10021683mg [Capsella rubella]